MKLSSEERPKRKTVLPTGGRHIARCIHIIDMGTHKTTYKDEKNPGEFKRQRNMYLGYELVNTNHVFDEKKGPQPFYVKRQFNRSLHEKSGLLDHFTQINGGGYTADELKSFDVFKRFLAKGLEINVLINPDKNGKKDDEGNVVKYANIGMVSPVPAGTKVPIFRNTVVGFEIGSKECQIAVPGVDKEKRTVDWTEAWEHLYPWLQKEIMDSPEFREAAKRDNFNPTVKDSHAPMSNDAQEAFDEAHGVVNAVEESDPWG